MMEISSSSVSWCLFAMLSVCVIWSTGPPVRLVVLKNGTTDASRAATVVGPDLTNVSMDYQLSFCSGSFLFLNHKKEDIDPETSTLEGIQIKLISTPSHAAFKSLNSRLN